MVLLEEDYKDLSTHLFNSQFGLLDDFENSESIAEGSDNGSDKRERGEERQIQNNTEKTLSYENERKRSDPEAAAQVDTKKSQNTVEYNIYDDEQDDEDKKYSRSGRGYSNDEKEGSNNDSSYDPLNIDNNQSANIPNPPVNEGKPKFVSNLQKQTFDPRILDQNAKMMQMMAKNMKMRGGMYPGGMLMRNPMQPNMPMPMMGKNMPMQMMGKNMPMQMMGYNIHPQPIQMKPTINSNKNLSVHDLNL